MVTQFTDLPSGGQDAVNLVMDMFGDLFDNNDYGPFLGEFTKFGKDRVSELVPLAVGDICNSIAIPQVANYSVDTYPYTTPSWFYTLDLSLCVEVMSHLMRSYVEIPDTSRVGASDVVRRDYLTRWQSLLNDYQDRLKKALGKLTAEALDDAYSSGQYVRTLIDFPSSANMYIPWLSAERQSIWAWW